MNQQSSIEFELAQSSEGSVPIPKGVPAVDPTVIASQDDAVQGLSPIGDSDSEGDSPTDSATAPPSAAGSPDAARLSPESSVTDVTLQQSATGNALADKPIVTEEHNTVISNQLQPHDEPIPARLPVSAEELQARLFGSRDDNPNSRSSLRVGDMDVYEKIGAGGMGAVFRAVDTELSREVALKVLHPRVSADPALVARFRNEARACAQLNHDNIARVFFAGDDNGVHYIAYEYADGQTIKELIHERGQLSTAETINYAIQATLALGHIESAGIIHRDIKPSNIILTKSGRIKVVDLGLARRETEDSIADLTVAGTTLGTFDYLAPEQARDARAADIRSDIYSLGCSIYHMLTGCPPYPDGTAVQKMLDHQGKDPPDIRQKNKQVPRAMAEIVQRMMMTQPQERYQAPGQLLADLIHLASQMGLRSVPAEGIVWRRVPVTKVRDFSGNLFLAGAVAVICATALIMHFMPSKQEASGQLAGIQKWMLGEAQQSPSETTGSSGESGKVPESSTDSAQAKAPVVPLNVNGTSETADTATSANPDDTTQPEVVFDGFRIQRAGGTTDSYASLREAWDYARDGDIIELDFDGPAPAITTPLPRRLVQAAPFIELRAAKGRDPVIVFAVDSENPSSMSQYRRFLELSSDLQLHITGVDFQVDLSDATAVEDWSLFDFGGANRVRLKGCTIGVTNPQQIPLSIFRLRDGGAIDAESSRATTSIELTNSAVRGGCDLVRVQAQVESQVVFNECGFSIDGSLIRNVGSAEMLSQGALNLTIQHCTTITSQPMIVMQDSDVIQDATAERVLPTIQVRSLSSVFTTISDQDTLVEIRGNSYREELQELLLWNGVNNYYGKEIQVFYRIESGLSESDLMELDLDSWQLDWNRKRDTQETRPQVFTSDLWYAPSLVVTASAGSLGKLPIAAFELNSAVFATPGGQFSREDGELPGVNAYGLPAFPVNAPLPTVDDSPAAAESLPDNG